MFKRCLFFIVGVFLALSPVFARNFGKFGINNSTTRTQSGTPKNGGPNYGGGNNFPIGPRGDTSGHNNIGPDAPRRFKGNPNIKAGDRIGSNSPIGSKNSPLKSMRKAAKIKDVSVVESSKKTKDDTKLVKNDAPETKNIEINIFFAGPTNPIEFSNAEIMINGVKINNNENIKYNRTGTKARITISQSDITDLPSEYNISIVYPSGLTDAYVVSANPVQNKKLN
jgi:hypothetical protein